MMPQPVTQECVGIIGAVRDMLHMILVKQCLHIRSGDAKHRADYIAVDGRNRTQTLQACTAHQMHQNSFCIVISGMGCGNFTGQAA